jgi:hypothetical protein
MMMVIIILFNKFKLSLNNIMNFTKYLTLQCSHSALITPSSDPIFQRTKISSR